MLLSMAARFANFKGYPMTSEGGEVLGKTSIRRVAKSGLNIGYREALWQGYFQKSVALSPGEMCWIAGERYMLLRRKYEIESREASVIFLKTNVEIRVLRRTPEKGNLEAKFRYEPLHDGFLPAYEGVGMYRMRDLEEGREDSTKYTLYAPAIRMREIPILNDRVELARSTGAGKSRTDVYTVSSVMSSELEGVVSMQLTADKRAKV